MSRVPRKTLCAGIAPSYSKELEDLAQYLKAHGADEYLTLAPIIASRSRSKSILDFRGCRTGAAETMLSRGVNLYTLAKESRCRRETGANRLKEGAIVTCGNKISEAQIAEKVKLSTAGQSNATIAERVGVAEKSVSQYLRMHRA